MVSDKIRVLIEKYENAETSIQEENMLKEYFASENVDPEFEYYKPLFGYFAEVKNEEFEGTLPIQSKVSFLRYSWIAVAAVMVLMFGLYFGNPFSTESQQRTLADLTPQEKLEYEQAMEAFSMLGMNFKKGTDNLDAFFKASEGLQKGQENLALLTEFDNATDKIFKYE